MHPHKETDTNGGQRNDGKMWLEWWGVVGLGLVSLVLGTAGFMAGVDEHGKPWGFWDALYDSMRLFHMHFDHVPRELPWELQIARFLAPMVVVVTLVKGFLFAARSRRHALFHRYQKGHVVICGLGHKGLELARQFRKRRRWVVVIEKNPGNPLLAACDAEGIFYWISDAADPAVLERARVAHAREVIVVTPEDETNLRIAMQVRDATAAEPMSPVECFVQLENIDLRERLQRSFGARPAGGGGGCTLRFFDAFDAEARRVLLDLPLDGAGIPADSPIRVHVVIIGFGRMGRSLALRAAKLGHFANGQKLRISVIDRHPDLQREHLLFHYPVMEMICEMQFHHAEAESLKTRKLVGAWAAEPDTLLHLFVCLDDNTSAVEVALRLQEMLADRPDCNLCVRIKARAGLARLFEGSPFGGPPVRAFGTAVESTSREAFIPDASELMARQVHDAFVEKRLADSSRTPGNDPALKRWNELTEDLLESNRAQTDHMAIKMRAIGCEIVPVTDPRPPITEFSPADLGLLAPLEHRRWNAERLLASWQPGPQDDKPRRISASLTEWDRLPANTKKYDFEAVEDIPDRLAVAIPTMKLVRGNT